MATGKLKVHSENILPIIKKWLYSDKDIFLRELVSNSCDAISKLKILSSEESLEILDKDLQIDVKLDTEKKTLTITDTGIGMTHDEVEKYIAQVAFSGAEEFIEKYKSQDEKEQIIGHFGLGFFSAFMVSTKVEIQTLSYKKDAKPVFWTSDGSSEYEIDAGTRDTRGTEITLHIGDDSLEYLEEKKLEEILRQNCSYLPYPIHLQEKQVNHKDPLWMKPASECTEQEYLDFYRDLYPSDPEPLFWVHLNVDYPFHLKGILFFPKIHKRFDFQNNSVKLFCNRVFVSDNCKDLLPDYLMVLKGAIDSPDIPLNVSRSYLQMDKTVRSLGQHISKKITQKLTSLFNTDREKFITYWTDIEMILKLGVLQDEKFYDRIKDILIWKTTSSEWITTQEYLEKNSEKAKDTIYYTTEEKSEPELIELYKDKGIDVVFTNSVIDTPLINSLESKLSPITFKRIDAAVMDSFIDKEREKTVLDKEGKSESANIAEFIKSALDIQDLEVEAKSLTSDSIPALFVIDENTRRLRDFMMSHSGNDGTPPLPQKKTFVVNTNNKLVHKAYELRDKNSELSHDLVRQVYDLASLSQRELDADAISSVIARNTKVLEKLAELV